jgi:hypothetical protein
MRMRPHQLILPLLLALSACDGAEGTGAALAGGEYIAALESPHGPEGAAILEITGDGVEEVSGSAATLFQQPVSGGRRLVLVLEPAGRIEFRVRVSPGNELPEVRVVQVVDGNDAVRPSTDGYTVSFSRTRGDG